MIRPLRLRSKPDELAGRFRPTPAVPLDPSPGTRQGIINEKGDLSCPQSMLPTDGGAIDRGRSRARSRRVAFLRGVLSSPHSADIGQGRRGKGGAGRLTHPLKLDRCMLKSQTVIDLGPARSRFRERRSEAHYAEFAALRDRGKAGPSDPHRRHRRGQYGGLARTGLWGSRSAAGRRNAR